MPDRHIVIDRRHQCGEVRINGTSFRCTFRTDWGCRRFGVHPRDLVVEGIGLPHLKFGFAAPWDWILDLDATEMERCLLVRSQGYRTLDNGRVPYMWSRRYLFDDPDMLYEVVDACHLERKEYVIAGPAYGSMDVDPMLARVAFRGDGVSLWWQFRPRPVTALFEDAGRTWTFGFDREFQKYRGYSLLPYLPVLAGMTVKDPEVSQRFLRDFGRTLGDCFTTNCYSKLGELCHRAGLEWHAESGGPWRRDTLLFAHADALAFRRGLS